MRHGIATDYGWTNCCICGKAFQRKSAANKFCSDVCSKIAKRERTNAWRIEHAGMPREVFTKICPICGVSFRTTKKNKIYCSDDCRAAQGNAEKARKRFEENPRRAEILQAVREEEERRAKEKEAAIAHARWIRAEAMRRSREEAENAQREESRAINARSFTAGYSSVEMAAIAAANRMTYGKLQGLITCNGGDLPEHIRVPEGIRKEIET